ncbi:helix-turn-helix domain-containing protein [Nonomuraea rubra]|uniref:AraC family transcriptional regulator of arabinose operon n=1 Tax=Nonomuraea rubra TaxID=46180 RepID=A0A7X0TYW3_9ACTN|nr:helix-turn-helix domain-containing protein [Nonomuraea rubra]MBB6548654.1 AraC family transcriptional regulator of arabinose operon [Nonomuraea rubra]
MTAEDLSVPAAELMIVGHYDKGAGYATRRPGGSPSWLLLWTESGAGVVEQGGVSFRVEAGDLAVLGSGVAQHYRVQAGAGRWRFWWVHFQPRAAWAAWLGPHAVGGGCHVVAGVPEVVHERIGLAFLRALQDARWTPDAPLPAGSAAPGTGPATSGTGSAASGTERGGGERAGGREGRGGEVRVPAVVSGGAARELVMGAVEEVLVLATATARPAGRGEEGDERVRRALSIIAAEPGAPHSVASLARAVALSPSRFAHLFAEATGQTPMQAVRRARVRHAASLLEVTDMDVGQVAAASGFVSPFHFSRAFRKEYGLPPRDYRARLRPFTG